MIGRTSDTASQNDLGTTLLLAAIFTVAGAGAVLWLGGIAACWVSGRSVPHAAAVSGLRTLAHPGDPSLGWRTAMPGPILYWFITGCIGVLVIVLAVLLIVFWRRETSRRRTDVRATTGLATRREIRAGGSERALLRRARIIRPSLTHPVVGEVGYRLGRAQGMDVWTSAEDSLLILGPPRAGKGLHLVIPMLLHAPGPVITTSTRPDNLAATLARRQEHGPVAVFDPQALTTGTATDVTTRWSPIRGCQDPQTAMIRARALAAGTSEKVDNRGFWQAQTESALRAFLHAAALDGRDAGELYRWSLDPAAAGDAVRILNAHSRAASGWADALDAIVNGDPRTRDNSWAGIRIALSALADPRVLAAVTPTGGNQFDPAAFLVEHGTLYLLGTANGVGAAANLIAAFIEDILDVARRTAATAEGGRLDPPLALILDEAANYALPSLPSLISEGGGSGITTVAVLQSLAQARARWGEHEGAALWDAASVKIVLGGGSNARDLHDLSALIGDRDAQAESWSRDSRGLRTWTTNTRREPVLHPGQLRTLPFGTGVLLLRTAPPIVIDMTPWTAQPDRPRRRAAIRPAPGRR